MGTADRPLPLVSSKSQACLPVGPTEQGEGGGWESSLQGRGDTSKDREGEDTAGTEERALFLGSLDSCLCIIPPSPPRPDPKRKGMVCLGHCPCLCHTGTLRNLWDCRHLGSEGLGTFPMVTQHILPYRNRKGAPWLGQSRAPGDTPLPLGAVACPPSFLLLLKGQPLKDFCPGPKLGGYQWEHSQGPAQII